MKKIFLTIVLIIVSIPLYSHTPILIVEDNLDGTIYIEGGFSNGASATGSKIIIKDKLENKVLDEYTLGEDSYIDIAIPSVEYTITFDGGPGHILEKDGPFATKAISLLVDDPTEDSQIVFKDVQQPWVPSYTKKDNNYNVIIIIIGMLQLILLIYIAVQLKNIRRNRS